MAKRTSAWVPLAAALVALQVDGAAIAGSLESATAYDAGDGQKANDHASFDPGLHYGEERGVATDSIKQGSAKADVIRVTAELAADGKTIQVVVELVLPIDPDVVWAVLNDYENMPSFVPDIHATRLISAETGRRRVEIDGVARLLFMEFPTHTTMDVVHLPDGSIAIDSVAGNLAIHGVVRVHGDGDGPHTRVDYRVRMTPDFWLPPLIGDYLIGLQIRRQFEGMVAEMHRRADNIKNTPPGKD